MLFIEKKLLQKSDVVVIEDLVDVTFGGDLLGTSKMQSQAAVVESLAPVAPPVQGKVANLRHLIQNACYQRLHLLGCI
jgi:hypothetical protein